MALCHWNTGSKIAGQVALPHRNIQRDSKGKDEKPLGVVDAYVNNCIVCITKNPELSFPVTGLCYKNIPILMKIWVLN